MQLTPEELAALEDMLRRSGADDEADIARARPDSHGLGLFVRSLVGLDRAAAAEARGGHVPWRVQIACTGGGQRVLAMPG